MDSLHQRYAEEIATLGGISSRRVRSAFARVRREDFLPPGPWMIENLDGQYFQSDDANVTHILHGVGVAIDVARGLNNANPVRAAIQLQRINLQPGQTIFHVGAGLGYYSALMAELVGPTGHIIAAEIDPDLRAQATRNLVSWKQVTVIGDALEAVLPPVDLIYSSAGLGNLPARWLDALKIGGQMVVPITGPQDHGAVFLFQRITENDPWSAAVLSFTRHYPCLGTRTVQDLQALDRALTRSIAEITCLRRGQHAPNESCWLHGSGWCLSTLPPPIGNQTIQETPISP